MELHLYLPLVNADDLPPNAPQSEARQCEIKGVIFRVKLTSYCDSFTYGRFHDVNTHTLFLAPSFWAFMDDFSHGY